MHIKALKIVKAVAPFVGAFTGAVGGLAKAGLGKIAPGLFGVSKGQEAVGKSSGGSAKKMVASAKAFMMMGVGVLADQPAGFYLLAQSAIAVANAGPGAIAVFAGLDWRGSRARSWYDEIVFIYVRRFQRN